MPENNAKHNGNGPHRILLAVTGLSPQVVTETVYALAVESDPPWMPERIRLITTFKGAEQARLSLLGVDGQLKRLIDDYGLPPIAFGENDILVLKDEQGNPLDDIRTPDDNERAGDFILDEVRKLTEDPETELHVSIAGGRKTMGFYLGYALSLYGRPQDRLSHVLVSAPFESHREFFYPPPRGVERPAIQLADGTLADPHKARIMLAEIPFVRMRHGLDDELREGKVGFAEVVEAAQRALAPPTLVLNLEDQKVIASGVTISLPPQQLAFLSWFARRCVEGKPAAQCPKREVETEENKYRMSNPEYAEEYLREYRMIADEKASGTEQRLHEEQGMTHEFFMQTRSKLHRTLKRKLGPELARHFFIIGEGRSPKLYRLAIQPSRIQWAEA